MDAFPVGHDLVSHEVGDKAIHPLPVLFSLYTIPLSLLAVSLGLLPVAPGLLAIMVSLLSVALRLHPVLVGLLSVALRLLAVATSLLPVPLGLRPVTFCLLLGFFDTVPDRIDHGLVAAEAVRGHIST